MKYQKYYIGAEAGCIGRTNNGYAITDHTLVMVKSSRTDKVKRIFQVQEVLGIIENGIFVKAEPVCENICNCMAEPEYEMSYWVGEKKIPENDLTRQYKVKDITDVVNAIAAFDDKDSPYISKKSCSIFTRNRQLSTRIPAEKAIIEAIDAVMIV